MPTRHPIDDVDTFPVARMSTMIVDILFFPPLPVQGLAQVAFTTKFFACGFKRPASGALLKNIFRVSETGKRYAEV